MKILLRYGVIIAALILSACQTTHSKEIQDGPPSRSVNIDKIPNAVVKHEPKSRYGNPKTYKVLGKSYNVMDKREGYQARGIASWYGTKFQGKRTSSGEPYDMFKMTAAHKTLPLPSYAQITNLENGRKVIVKINDRGPFHPNRIIDLSYVAAKKLGISDNGTGLIELKVLSPKQSETTLVAEKPKKQPQLYLQVGAFSMRENAEKLADKIGHITQEKVRLQQSDNGSNKIYRVQIGPLVGVGQSDKIHSSIKTAGIGDAIAIIR